MSESKSRMPEDWFPTLPEIGDDGRPISTCSDLPHKKVVCVVFENGAITTESGWYIGHLADTCDYDGLEREAEELRQERSQGNV